MLRELSLNILDIAQNSLAAGARNISVTIAIDTEKDDLRIIIADDGCGMDDAALSAVCDPFFTTRATRKTGLGLPFFKMAAEAAGGALKVSGAKGKGAFVEASFVLSHIDRMPLGDLSETVLTLITGAPETDFLFEYGADGRKFVLSSREIRSRIQGADMADPAIAGFLREYIAENIADIDNGRTF